MASVWNDIKAVGHNLGEIKMAAATRLHVFGYGSALLVSRKGEVYALGKNKNGCLALDSEETREPKKIPSLSSVSGVSVCDYFGDAMAYTREGKLYVWGVNVHGNAWRKPVLLQNVPNIIDTRCIRGHYLALSDNGKVYEWRGTKTCHNSLNALKTKPVAVELSEAIVAIACGPLHSLAVTKCGDVYSFGNVLLNGRLSHQPATKIPLPGETVAKVACGDTHSLALTHSGRIYTWGGNTWGLGDDGGNIKESALPLQVGGRLGRFTDLATNGLRTNAAITKTGAVYMWGCSEEGLAVVTPTLTQWTELHQVFSKVCYGTCAWTYQPSLCLSKDNSYCVAEEDSASLRMAMASTFNVEVLKTELGANNLKLKVAKLEENLTKLEQNYIELQKENLELRELKNKTEDHLKLKPKLLEIKSDQLNAKMASTQLEGGDRVPQQGSIIPDSTQLEGGDRVPQQGIIPDCTQLEGGDTVPQQGSIIPDCTQLEGGDRIPQQGSIIPDSTQLEGGDTVPQQTFIIPDCTQLEGGDTVPQQGSIIPDCTQLEGGDIVPQQGSIIPDCTQLEGGDTVSQQGFIIPDCTQLEGGDTVPQQGSIIPDCTQLEGGDTVPQQGSIIPDCTQLEGGDTVPQQGSIIPDCTQLEGGDTVPQQGSIIPDCTQLEGGDTVPQQGSIIPDCTQLEGGDTVPQQGSIIPDCTQLEGGDTVPQQGSIIPDCTQLEGGDTVPQHTFIIPDCTDDSTNPESVYSEKAEAQKEVEGGVVNPETVNFEITEEYRSKEGADGRAKTGQLDIKGTNTKTQTYQSEVKESNHKAERDHLETEEISRKGERSYEKLKEDYRKLQKLNAKLEKEKANLAEDYNKLREKYKKQRELLELYECDN